MFISYYLDITWWAATHPNLAPGTDAMVHVTCHHDISCLGCWYRHLILFLKTSNDSKFATSIILICYWNISFPLKGSPATAPPSLMKMHFPPIFDQLRTLVAIGSTLRGKKSSKIAARCLQQWCCWKKNRKMMKKKFLCQLRKKFSFNLIENYKLLWYLIL